MKTFIAALFLFSSFANANVKVKKSMDQADDILKTHMADVKKACGADVKVELDRKSFEKSVETSDTAFWCQYAFNAIVDVCADKDYKDVIAKQVKKVKCSYDEDLKNEGNPTYGNKIDLKDGTLFFTYNNKTQNPEDTIRSFLKNKL